MSDRIRVGVAGTGFSAASHLDALARVPYVVCLVDAIVKSSRAERWTRVAGA